MLPQTNARLLSIAGDPSPSEDWDVSAGPTGGSIVWAGDEDAYVDEKVTVSYANIAGGQIRQRRVTLIIPADLVDGDNDALTLQTGQVVTYNYRGTNNSRRILDYAAPHLPGMGLSIYEYVKLDLDPTPVEVTVE
jgi:hypothetical protein